MEKPDLLTKLYQRMTAEQKRYRNWLMDLSKTQARALLKSRTPLADIYTEWNKTETHHMEDLRDMIETRADAVIRAEKEKSQRGDR